MKERRKGPIGRAAGLAEGVAATVRRMQREREPRVLVYDETGYARLVQPDGRGYERLLDIAERMVALVSEVEAEAKPRLGRKSDGAEETKERRPGRDAGDDPKPRRTARDAGEDPKPRRARQRASTDEPKPRRPRRAPPEDGA